MNLAALQAEVEAHGFDPSVYGARIVTYLNDAYLGLCRRVDYYVDEASQVYTTITGTASYPFPVGWARIREVNDPGRQVLMEQVSVRDIDASTTSQGRPNYWAQDGQNITFYPTPDNAYTINMRYWILPAPLASPTDTPTIPTDYHYMLAEYAIARCYWGDDDSTMGTQWDNKYATSVAKFTADVRFPSTDYPTQCKGMWENERDLGNRGWALWGWV
jgi:hypothetical protein